jgi:hypothetical protein
MDQTSANAPATSTAQAPQVSQPANTATPARPPGFRTRGRARRRLRFLRKARELAYRDLGGLVFNLHRFGQRNDALVIAKLGTLSHIDAELRSLETALGEHQPVTVLREAGITACPRCAAIHSGEDRFCPNCGLSMGRHVDLPIAGAASTPPAPSPAPPPAPAPAPAPAPTMTAPSAASSGHGVPGATTSPPAAAPATPPPSARTPGPAPVPASRSVERASSGPPPATPGREEPTEILRPPTAGA